MSDSERNQQETEATHTPANNTSVPPDGGYGWVVVGALFVIYILCNGLYLTLGIYLDDLVEVGKVTNLFCGKFPNFFYQFSNMIQTIRPWDLLCPLDLGESPS